MRITIAERLRPFSHLPGTSFVLPGSSLNLQVFPALIHVSDLSGGFRSSLAEISLDLEGPVDGFTALLDLEKGCLCIFGKSVKGYFRYVVKAIGEGQGIAISVEKAPPSGIVFLYMGKWTLSNHEPVQAGQKIILSEKALTETSSPSYTSLERLSLGSHKKQDWELLSRRLSFDEIFPLWHRLGQMVPKPSSSELAGVSQLLNDCKKAIEDNAPEKILPEFKKIFLAGFNGVLSPRLVDTDHQGIKYPEIDPTSILQTQISAMTLLTEGAKLIRSLFIQGNAHVHVLPFLPPEFHCGRLINAHCGKQGNLALEWTKKSLRLMTFQALEDQKIAFSFANHEKKCRLRSSDKDRGVVYLPGSEIEIVAGQHYWFDHFER